MVNLWDVLVCFGIFWHVFCIFRLKLGFNSGICFCMFVLLVWSLLVMFRWTCKSSYLPACLVCPYWMLKFQLWNCRGGVRKLFFHDLRKILRVLFPSCFLIMILPRPYLKFGLIIHILLFQVLGDLGGWSLLCISFILLHYRTNK